MRGAEQFYMVTGYYVTMFYESKTQVTLSRLIKVKLHTIILTAEIKIGKILLIIEVALKVYNHSLHSLV